MLIIFELYLSEYLISLAFVAYASFKTTYTKFDAAIKINL
jgi:hypothetical protein